jgi:two-component system, NtrC family, response regulator HydG
MTWLPGPKDDQGGQPARGRPATAPVPAEPARAGPVGGFIGQHPRVLAVLDLVRRVADTDATVLILGESGTGKELIARALHENSSRRTAPFLPVNCGAIAETLQESELFGHARGAFTGATEAKVGKFGAADGGTVFLDEIAETSKSLQVKLLRILQHGEYSPVGLAENRSCDVRIVAATNRDLRPLVAAESFRKDLYYRLNIIRLDLPPLRERRSDIPLLIDHFLKQFRACYHKHNLEMSGAAVEALCRHDFPGNVRELENIMRRAAILCSGPAISVADLGLDETAQGAEHADAARRTFHEAKAQVVGHFEQTYLVSILTSCGGIISRAARRAGLSERNFHEKLKKYGLSGKHFRAVPAGGPELRPGP